MTITTIINLILSLFLVDAFSPNPNSLNNLSRSRNLQPLRETLAGGSSLEESPLSTTVNDDNDDANNSSKSKGFWYQPNSVIRSRLKSKSKSSQHHHHQQPPDEILARIREEPYRGAFEPVQDFSHPITPKITQGSIPKDLVGTFAINSAGRIRVGGRMLGHWFDGDGYMTTLSFDGRSNDASVFGRFIRTGRFKAQEEQDKRRDATASFDDDNDDVNYEPPLAFSGAWTKAGTGKWYENIGKSPQSPANTAVMWLPSPLDEDDDSLSSRSSSNQPRLFALCEGGHPIQLDPNTLDVVREEAPFTSSPSSSKSKEAVSSFFSAHFAQDPHTKNILNHGYILDPLSSISSINLMKLSPDGYLLEQKSSEIPYNSFIHDATISQNLYMYFICPYIVPKGMVELVPFISGQEALGSLMNWKGGEGSSSSRSISSNSSEDDDTPLKSYLHIHSKDNLNLKWSIEIPHAVSVYHIVDAYEEDQVGSKDIVLKIRIAELNSDNPTADRNKLEKQFSNQYAVPSKERLHAKLTEYVFSLRDDGSGEGKLMSTRDIGSSACEYPETTRVGGDKRLQYTWVNALDEDSPGWFDAVQKIDMVNSELSSPTISFGQGTYCGPPLFVPKERLSHYATESNRQYEEDEGYAIVVLYRSESHSSSVVILDSSSMETLCTMELDCHLPYSFHGEFQEGFVS